MSVIIINPFAVIPAGDPVDIFVSGAGSTDYNGQYHWYGSTAVGQRVYQMVDPVQAGTQIAWNGTRWRLSSSSEGFMYRSVTADLFGEWEQDSNGTELPGDLPAPIVSR